MSVGLTSSSHTSILPYGHLSARVKVCFLFVFPFFKESLSYSNWQLKEKSLYSYDMGISVRKWISLIPNLARGVLK